GGVSPEPWQSLNLGLNVTDDAARVRANRARAGAWLGAPVAFASQVHGTDVAVVTDRGSAADSVGESDAMVAVAAGVGLGVLVADCVPVLLADVEAGVVGVAHAGRRGLAHGVLPPAHAAMRSPGASAAAACAALAPRARG